jgi:hypothetical protein
MPTEALRQALRAVNVAGVESNFAEVLAKMFDIPVPVAARVLYAIEYVKDPVTWRLGLDQASELIPDPEVRKAIREQANAGALRVHLRNLQLAGRQVKVKTQALVPKDEPSRICEGCPHTMTCVAELLSTPEKCSENLSVEAGHGFVNRWQKVTLVRVTAAGRVTVKAAQPLGEHELSVHDVELF